MKSQFESQTKNESEIMKTLQKTSLMDFYKKITGRFMHYYMFA